MEANPQQGSGALVRAALVILPLAALRVAFRAIKDGVLDADAPRLVARHVARHGLEAVALAALPALLLCALAGAATRRRAGTLATAGLVLGGAALGFAFVTFRLPADAMYVVEHATTRGWIALAVAAMVALGASALALPNLRLPLARAAATLVPLGCVAAACVLLAWPPRARDGRPNLILISLDTLRRDHVGCYGYERETTPAFDAFAARSLRFDNAFSVMPWTLTAHMSMLTGLYPAAHGLTEQTALPRGIPTLADQLGMAGYVTLGIADEVAYLGPSFGYDRGFDVYEQVPDDAALKVARIQGLLDDVGDDPFFLFAHFYDAHSDWRELPYEAHADDLAELAPWFDGDTTPWCSPEGHCASRLLLEMFKRDEQFEGEALERLVDLYDAGVRTLDRELGRLLADLEDRGLLENTAVLITSDHGEEFFDHGKPLHGRCFDECLAVPFVLYTPPGITADAEAVGRSTDVVVSHVDILPTLLDLAGVKPAQMQQGISLAPLARGDAAEEARAVTRQAVVIEQIDGFRGLRSARYSLVPFGAKLLLFDVLRDPAQRRELRGPEAAPARRKLRGLLEAENEAAELLRGMFAADAVNVSLSAEERALLQNLGYAGE